MNRPYKHREMRAEDRPEQEFFFPKNNPPVTIKAASREDAERKLEALNKKEND